jgi:hypothetical protein
MASGDGRPASTVLPFMVRMRAMNASLAMRALSTMRAPSAMARRRAKMDLAGRGMFASRPVSRQSSDLFNERPVS